MPALILLLYRRSGGGILSFCYSFISSSSSV